MSNNKTITINGRKYDSITGLPIKSKAKPDVKPAVKTKAATKPAPKTAVKTRGTVKATSVHSTTERSKTLRRSAAKKPTPAAKAGVKHPTRGRTMDIARSSRVSKFSAHPETKPITSPKFIKKATAAKADVKPVPKPKPVTKPVAKPAPKPATKDKAAKTHPMTQRALQRKQSTKPKVTMAASVSSKDTKDAAIKKALEKPTKKARTKNKMPTWKKRFLIGTACAVLLIGGGLAVYRLIPSVSVSIAAAQAGVRASYPEYTPDGFSLHHPVTYSEGEVLLTFASNSNDDSYTISQTKSSWDSTAVLDNIVRSSVGDNYVTTQERGLTIYSYETSASWVNGGVLYTITSNAKLSNEQIRRIATSI